MKKLILASMLLAGLVMPSFAAEPNASPGDKVAPTMSSQTTGTLSSTQKTGFMTWSTAQKPLSHEYKGTLAVGTILPSTILFTAVPAEFGPTNMQWALVNHRTILVNPTTREITQILD